MHGKLLLLLVALTGQAGFSFETTYRRARVLVSRDQSNILQNPHEDHNSFDRRKLSVDFQLQTHTHAHKWANKLEKDVDINTSRYPYGRFLAKIFRMMFYGFVSIITNVMNKTVLHDEKGNLMKYCLDRDHDIGCLTISNHQSILDDPGIFIACLPWRKLTSDSLNNIVMDDGWYYALGKFSANIFRSCNCIPIHRGDLRGLEVPGLREMHNRLNGINGNGFNKKLRNKREWAHIMTEGRLYQSWRFPEGVPKLGKFRKGAAKLIACSPPKKLIVLPVYHRGMDEIFPEEKPKEFDVNDKMAVRVAAKTNSLFPKRGKTIDIFVGDPISFEDILPEEGFNFMEETDKAILETVNERLFSSLLELEAKARKHRGEK